MKFAFDMYTLERFMKKLNLSVKPRKQHIEINPRVYDTLVRAGMTFLLFSIDFILFVGSGNFSIFNGGSYSSEIFTIIAVFAVLTFIIYACLFKWRIVQDFLVSLSVGVFVYALYNQFAQFDFHGFLADWLSTSPNGFLAKHSDFFISILFAGLAFWFYFKNKRYIIAYVTFLIFAIFFGVVANKFFNFAPKSEFVVSYNNQNSSSDKDEKGQKVVFIFLPEASSYKTIERWDSIPESQKAVDILTAFYAKNRFELFPNAYTDEKIQFLNLVKALNSQRQNDVFDDIMRTRMLYKYWKFFNLIDEYVYLQNNDLFETYANSGFKTSAYKSRVVDLCHKNHQINVDRCVEKISKPVNIYGKHIASSEKMKIIFAEWLESTKLFGNLSGLYNMFSMFSDVDKTPLVGINYSNLYVINSIKTLDRLYDDLAHDNGNQAYFVFVDLPADMYIYNEFCEIKPTSQWVSLVNLPWIKSKNEDLKRSVYLQQTLCLYGKLEEFMQRLETSGLINDTTIILQGLSSFNRKNNDNSFVDNFIDTQLVTMAYKDENSKYFKLSENICHTSNILNSLLYGSEICNDLEGINAHISIKREILHKLRNKTLDEDYLQKIVSDFNKWYSVWKLKNQPGKISKEIDLGDIKDDAEDESEIDSEIEIEEF